MSVQQSNRKLIRLLVFGAVGMFGFGYALVPLYDILCEQLGINGKTSNIASTYQAVTVDKSRLITVEFISNVRSDMPWKFEPKVTQIEVNPGEVVRTQFLATNLSSKAMVGQAVPSVSPGQGATYFNKIECFCFNNQPLGAQADAELPLIFYVDPALPESISTLTLSYTLYNITASESAINVAQGAENNDNQT
ncbi:cytochrome c oxidase assembly protein [Aliivibrio kagoshimensis]|uniref:cytochrome c oxidase assembly protein n=1 Tax=Aliivibrio kagoshimensis TaxID=2910230 RepID=UPI003D0D9826